MGTNASERQQWQKRDRIEQELDMAPLLPFQWGAVHSTAAHIGQALVLEIYSRNAKLIRRLSVLARHRAARSGRREALSHRVGLNVLSTSER